MSMTERLCFGAGSDPVAMAERAVEVLRRPGSVVLLPTETVYGLVCRAEDRDAVERIYALKDRDFSKPLSWFVFDWRTLGRFGVILEIILYIFCLVSLQTVGFDLVYKCRFAATS